MARNKIVNEAPGLRVEIEDKNGEDHVALLFPSMAILIPMNSGQLYALGDAISEALRRPRRSQKPGA